MPASRTATTATTLAMRRPARSSSTSKGKPISAAATTNRGCTSRPIAATTVSSARRHRVGRRQTRSAATAKGTLAKATITYDTRPAAWYQRMAPVHQSSTLKSATTAATLTGRRSSTQVATSIAGARTPDQKLNCL